MIRKLLMGLLLLLAVAAGVVFWQVQQLQTWAARKHAISADTVVTIPRGAGPSEIVRLLADAGVIDDSRRLWWYARFVQPSIDRFKSGEYAFRADTPQSPDDIIERLVRGEVRNEKVTIPEGLRLEEQAELFDAAGIVKAADYVRWARDPAFVRSFDIKGDSLEGYLFPDTYLVPKTIGVKPLLRLMVDRFRKAWKVADAGRWADVTLSQAQAVTLASIIEKETGQGDERPRIACVFHNRLRKGMKLQTDPTVMYAAFLATGEWSKNIRRVDLDRVHPYNTYAVRGLPPGPIANAGEAALKAALRPAACDDLFFVSRNDGSHVFCPDLACHEANVQRWQVEYFRQKQAGP